MIKNCFDNPGTYLSEKEIVEFGPGSRWHEGIYAAAIDFGFEGGFAGQFDHIEEGEDFFKIIDSGKYTGGGNFVDNSIIFTTKK